MKTIFSILFAITILFCNAQITKVFQITTTNKFGNNPSTESDILNDEYYSFADISNSGMKLRKFDGTSVTEVFNFPAYYTAVPVISIGFTPINRTENKLFFIVQHFKRNPTTFAFTEFTEELWATDGTQAGTVSLIKDVRTSTTTNFRIDGSFSYGRNINNNFIGNKLIFSYKGNLMVSDGTVAGTQPLTANGAPVSHLSYPGPKINGKFYFGSTDGIYATDGTDAGTEKIVENTTVQLQSHMSDPINGKFLFWGKTAANGTELWESDGTAAGTKLFYETIPGPNSSNFNLSNQVNLANDGKQIYFVKLTTAPNSEIWATDITLSNTRMVRAESPFAPTICKLLNGQIFFKEQNNSTGKQNLWRSDGTMEGTVMLSDGFDNKSMAIYQNSLFYDRAEKKIPISSVQADDNIELWKSDGLLENTRMIKDINPGMMAGSPFNESNSSNPHIFFTLNNILYFQANDGTGNFLYRINGDYTFKGSTGTTALGNPWSNEENWNSGIVPGQHDLVNIPAGFNVNVDANAYAKNLSAASPVNLGAGNLNITGELVVDAKITLNNNSLNLKGTAITAEGNSTNYIVTNGTGTVNVENLNSTRGSVNLPIGTATNYNPVSIANTGTSDTFSARVSDGISNTTNGAVNATWEISEATAGGSNVSLTLGWNTSQQNAAFDSGTAKVGHYLNGNWTEENSGEVSNNSITATGISSFSPFAVMNFGALAASDFSKSKVLIYPNPFNENLNISTENGGVVHFYDLSGKLVSTSVLMKGTNSLNKSSLTKGVYIYQIKNVKGDMLASGKVVKK
ncbi:T9SS type A sorting domain-containing protein [uncultured Chryseobacterium sp.]|uniref:T9SS type A sorting domain-containing protein n=1 Tax=uncultured Chryseobacterium sp. TaxID=259322 RepID=UPI002612259C|nr:T9SS type A sorting domain-containing protein [uncultured Chryseobacterium sp.]